MSFLNAATRLATVTLSVGVLTAGSLAAQDVDLNKARSLETEAEQLLQDQDNWRKAAKLLREAAAYRPEGDAQARADLFQASRLAYYRGQETRALYELEDLADRALAEGDVLTAAQALADAAWIANEEGMGGKTIDLSKRAQKLAMSPLISEAQRSALQERFDGTAG